VGLDRRDARGLHRLLPDRRGPPHPVRLRARADDAADRPPRASHAAANASAYVAGHDHCAEYLEQYGFAHHGVGAAHLYDASTAHAAAVPSASLKWHYLPGDAPSTKDDASRGAFAAATWDGASLRVVHYDQDGAAIFAAPPVPPRDS